MDGVPNLPTELCLLYCLFVFHRWRGTSLYLPAPHPPPRWASCAQLVAPRTTNMSNPRHAYTALTPDYAEFSIPRAAGTPSEQDPTLFDVEIEEAAKSSRWCMILDKAKAKVKNNVGLLLVAGSQAFFSMMNVAVKKLNSIDPPVSTLQLVAIRMTITYICCLIYMYAAKVPDPFLGPKGVRMLLAFRGFSGFFGLFGIYYSLQFLSLSDATVITFLAPLCTGIAGALLLKENFTKKEALASFFSLCGVILIARPVALFGDGVSTSPDSLPIDGSEKGTPAQRLVAVGVALLGVLGSTGAYISLRAIGKKAHPLHPMTSFSIVCICVSTTSMIATHSPFILPKRIDWLALLFMIGIFGFVAQVLLTMGLARETAGRGSMAVYTQVVFATILERIFFKSTPSILSVTGTLMIITSALYVALTKEQTKTKTSIMTLETIHEDELEEGLLERTRDGEAAKDPALPPNPGHAWTSPKPLSRSSLDSDTEETSALSPKQTTKPCHR
ncbi:EamA-like transporter family-domain-containing protein [Collybia nuda]|uniref:EamA-like transporter family-domain-containing protein n=1 Tax=Collybia nuda TaxID=64659 RepID=A0A9P5YGZ8_9AGAR|nr:EamA-like transporter family-domain-containing protein [Collybia nuda]